MKIFYSGIHRCRGEAVDKILEQGPPISVLSSFEWFLNRGVDSGFKKLCSIRKHNTLKENQSEEESKKGRTTPGT